MASTSSVGRRLLLAVAAAAVAFGVGWSVPVPNDGDHDRESMTAQVKARFPGWEIVNLTEGHESSWVVAVRCGSDEVGFRLIQDARPVTGLPLGDYWVSPANGSSRTRLRKVAQPIEDWLLWRQSPAQPRQLGCDRGSAAGP
ncbi:MAG: hypothetical protein ABR509_03815 [Candidatus Limnocylindria bacterium]